MNVARTGGLQVFSSIKGVGNKMTSDRSENIRKKSPYIMMNPI